METFTEQVIQIILGISPGSVMSYGEIARLAGSPRAARQVVRILHTMTEKYGLPWHRVVNSRYEIAIKDEKAAQLQKQLLMAEGIAFDNLKCIARKEGL